jgi:hypothetical protein
MHDGSLWICRRAGTTDAGAPFDHGQWQLAVKRGHQDASR